LKDKHATVAAGKKHAAAFGDAVLSMRAAALLTTPARTIASANAAAAALFACETSELTDLPARTLYASAADWAASEALVRALSEAPSPAPLGITVRRQSGELEDVSLLMLPVHNDDGQLANILELMTPAAGPSSLSTMTVDTGILRFARGAAHDFKNLLAIITGNLQLALSENRRQDVRGFLKDADYASAMAARLADQLIGFAQDSPHAPVRIDISSSLMALAPLLQNAAGLSVTLIYDISPAAQAIVADRSGFENAILNLVINARDAMPDGGTINVTARPSNGSPTLTADGATNPPKSYVAISMTDTGAGMTDRVRERAFDPFFSTKSFTRGTGLGLATVLGFARQSGGTATIASTLAQGTTVTLYLPAAARE
jgi:signal transduction histidine kinase